MHYFLGLEVWQQKGEIFLGQGRYATEILKRLGMGDCRPMSTPMITNWKKIDASKLKRQGCRSHPIPTTHRVPDVSGQYQARYLLRCQHPQSVHGGTKEGTLGSSQTHSQKKYGGDQDHVYNQSCIKLSENPVFHDRSKHIDIQCHFVRDCVQRGAVQLSYTPIGEQVADILTKALGKSKFDYFREKMRMVKNPFQK
eukprot:PITA_02385